MARGRRKLIIQSHDEYMSEEHIGEERHEQNTAASELHPSARGDQNTAASELHPSARGDQNTASSELDPSARGDQIDSDGDIEVNFHDEAENRVKRGKTKLKDIWNLPRGHRIVVKCNEFDQPIGVEAGFLGKFLGMVARNGCLCSLSYKDWRLLIGKRENNTNEQKNKKEILKQVKMRFLYPSRMEKWILRTIGERWRQHKSNLKSMYFDEHKSTKVNHSSVPAGIISDQWIALVDNWMTQKALDISKKNRINSTKKKSTHTAGTKSFARNREELREKDPEKKYPHRAVLYIHTHQTKSEKNTNAHVGDLKKLIVQQPGLAETSQGKVAWKGDALSKILGEEKPGHVHGLGLVPNPNQVFELSTSKRLKNVNLTSLDETSSEDVVSVRLEVEKLRHHVRNQDATILQLQQKTRTLEQKQIRQGCLDDPMYAPKDGNCTNVPIAKRKRVYCDPRSQDFSMDEDLNYTMNGQYDNMDDDDLQPNYKYNRFAEKVVEQETSSNFSNIEASRYQKEQDNYVEHEDLQAQYKQAQYKYNCTDTDDKIKKANPQDKKGLSTNRLPTVQKEKHIHNDIMLDKSKYTNATKVAANETSSNRSNFEAPHYQKDHHSTTNRSTSNSMMVGTKVFLKSWINQKKIVALATVVSCDPTQKLDGVQLGREFWMVRISVAFVDNEPLIRPYKDYKVIGDVQGVTIAWPSTFVEKIEDLKV